VLIVTIDEKEYLRLGLLLQQTFPGARQQMVSITINPKGASRQSDFARVDEYAFFLFFGSSAVSARSTSNTPSEVRWPYLRRSDVASARGTKKGGPSQFYPIFVDPTTQRIAKIGSSITPDVPLEEVEAIDGLVTVFPIREDGKHMNWGLTAPSLRQANSRGFVRVSLGHQYQPYTVAYMTGPAISKADSGEYIVTGERADGSKIVLIPMGKEVRPTTVWRDLSHSAGDHGTGLLGQLLRDRPFPFPKSLFAVEDAVRIAVADKPDAVILDFFAGSGTTAHAVMRLNRQDSGSRQAIIVTNNEVSADEAKSLTERGFRDGDAEWEALGIFEYITRPRVTAAATGLTPDGTPIKGDYKFTDEFPMAEGFEENVEFLKLTYLDPVDVELDRAFAAVAPLLWARAGGQGSMIEQRADAAGELLPFATAGRYGVLFDPDRWREFAATLTDSVQVVFVVTDSTVVFAGVAEQLPEGLEAVRLYENYLTTFAINRGSAS
ncbi:MAG TPA: DNA methyltransferase, partial [Ilumatobacteraceae bacterium]|nr:DNA methyltransferase [Ilumatobacteraceae bacterium]